MSIHQAALPRIENPIIEIIEPVVMTPSNELPTKLHRGAGAVLLLGLTLIVISMLVENDVLRRTALVTFSASVCTMLAADLYRMFVTGEGFGRLGCGVSQIATPLSFWLHFILRAILLLLFAWLVIFSITA
jgi:hypothetical protein